MTLKRAKSIDELYEEVRDFDYVLTCDAALATALNAKIDDYRLGGFAYTPKQIAGMLETQVLGEKAYSDLETIEAIEKETGFDFAYIHGELENIRDIMKYTENVEGYLPTRKSKTVLEAYYRLPTLHRLMQIYEPDLYRTEFSGKRCAVIGVEFFNQLDKKFIPLEHTEIDLFGKEEFSLDTVYAIGNDRQIAGSVVDLISPETADDTAIVLDASGPIADAVRSALYRKKIPFKNGLDVKDLSQIRDFVEFLSLALDYETLRAADVRELFSAYQKGNRVKDKEYSFLTPKMDRYLLSRVPFDKETDPTTRRLMETMRDIRQMTFGEAMERLFEGWPQRKTSVAILVDAMHLTEERITSVLVNRISYAVNNISDLKHNEQVPEYEKHGVLLADCRNAYYVDRPFVIFIGLDSSWNVTAAGKDYVDKEALEEQNADRISILLQQGEQRIYAVKPVTDGKETMPGSAFQTIYPGKRIENFADICSEYRKGTWFTSKEREKVATGESGVAADPEPEDFSKSTYNNYADCPLKYMFGLLVPTEDNDKAIFGNVLHDFAEFYFCYPETVKERGLDYYVERLNTIYAGISSDAMEELDASKFRVFLRNITRFIDRVRPEEVPLDSTQSGRSHPNIFMIGEGMNSTSSMTEAKFDSKAPLFAKYDLCIGNIIFDYKTGEANDAKSIRTKFSRTGNRFSEFQPLIYLQALSENRGIPCSFKLFYLGANLIESLSDDFDIMRNVREIRLCSETLPELAFGLNGSVYNNAMSKAKYQPLNGRWDVVQAELTDMYANGTLSADADTTELLNMLGLKHTKGNADMITGVFKLAVKELENDYLVIGDDTVLVPSDSMKKFVEQLTADHAACTHEKKIPVYQLKKGRLDCKQCNYRKICIKAEEEAEDGTE